MTNWMTAAGIALIAGGIATLIGFRHVLLSARAAGSRTAGREGVVSGTVVRGDRRRRDDTVTVPSQIRARRRRQALAAAPVPMALEPAPVTPALEPAPVALEPAPVPQELDPAPAGGADVVVDEPTGTLAALPPAGQPVAPAPRRDGDRIQGWVRPHYEDDEPASGEYWTPVPDTSYGWPVPVERLPRVDAYPSSRFEPDPDPRRTDAPQWPPTQSRPDPRRTDAPQWPPMQSRTERDPAQHDQARRDRAQRDWAERDAQPRRDETTDPDRRRSPVRRRAVGDLPVNDAEVPRRPRPRPRPSAGGGNANGNPDRSNVYRSRHAADPS